VSVSIERLDGGAALAVAGDLAGLIADAVAGGASVGFLSPPGDREALAWAEGVAAEVESGRALLLVARAGGVVCGSVQLLRASSPNGAHRGEVAKLLVRRDARRQGIGRALMEAVEAAARAAGLRTLVLDTETGSDAERLYRLLGWTAVGTIPEYAASPAGGLRKTSIYYRLL
jgi:ribosomal protein S18 acetylase RimI-like enzyme